MDFPFLVAFVPLGSFIASMFGCMIWHHFAPETAMAVVRRNLGFILAIVGVGLTLILQLATEFLRYPEIAILAAGVIAFSFAYLIVSMIWKSLSTVRPVSIDPLPCPRFSRYVATVFSIFCTLVNIVFLTSLVSGPLLRAIVPFIGWYCFFPYMGGGYWMDKAFNRHCDYLARLQNGRSEVVMAFIFGLFDFLMGISMPSFPDNPMLYYHPLRPLFTMALPLVWFSIIQQAIVRAKRFQEALRVELPGTSCD